MDNLIIEKKISTPYINFNYKEKKLIFSGESYPENAIEFYTPVLNWIRQYFSIKEERITIVNFEMVYFNSTTSKIFLNIFDLFDEMTEKGEKIIVNWITSKENDMIIECGEEFKEDYNSFEFNIIIK